MDLPVITLFEAMHFWGKNSLKVILNASYMNKYMMLMDLTASDAYLSHLGKGNIYQVPSL